jgi:hypothetical protein
MATRKPATDKILSRRVLVTVKRDALEVVPRIVWEHEIPLLEEVHGEGNIVRVDAKTMDESYNPKPSPDMLVYNKKQDMIKPPSETAGIGYVFAGDARSEHARLGEVYGKMPEENRLVVEHVYGRFQEGRFSAVVGRAEVEDMPEAQLRETIISYGWLPQTAKDSTDAERREASEARRKLFEMPHGELVDLAVQVTGALVA